MKIQKKKKIRGGGRGRVRGVIERGRVGGGGGQGGRDRN